MGTELQLIDPKTIGSELQKYKSQMEAALPRHMTADRMARIALTSLRVNPKLMNCTRESFYGSLMAASQLGLEPGINGQCYLIPYKDNRKQVDICTLVPGWRGYMDLLNRTERAAARTEAVYDGDEFDYEMGTDLKIHHKHGKWGGNEDAITHTYAVGKVKGIENFPIIDVWDVDKIKWHRNKNNKVGDRHYSYVHFEMYARKIPLLQILKYLPSSIELANASALDITGNEGRQSLTIDMALKGELENGGGIDVPSASDPIEAEIDTLFEKLGMNPQQQKMLRDGHPGRNKDLVEHLRGRLAPAVQVTTQPTGSHATVVMPHPDPAAGQDNSRTGLEKRGRGRPSKEETARRKAADVAELQTMGRAPTEDIQSNSSFPADQTDDSGQEDSVQQDEQGLPDTGGSVFDLI